MATPTKFVAGEAKLVTFTVVDEDGNSINLAGTTLTYAAALMTDLSTAVISKVDGDFLTHGNGSCTVKFSATNLATEGNYKGELKIVFAADNIDKSHQYFEIESSLT